MDILLKILVVFVLVAIFMYGVFKKASKNVKNDINTLFDGAIDTQIRIISTALEDAEKLVIAGDKTAEEDVKLYKQMLQELLDFKNNPEKV